MGAGPWIATLTLILVILTLTPIPTPLSSPFWSGEELSTFHMDRKAVLSQHGDNLPGLPLALSSAMVNTPYLCHLVLQIHVVFLVLIIYLAITTVHENPNRGRRVGADPCLLQ